MRVCVRGIFNLSPASRLTIATDNPSYWIEIQLNDER
jgi:hypothetical protein